LVVAVVSSW